MHRCAERVHRAHGGIADGIGHSLFVREHVVTRMRLEVAPRKTWHRRFYPTPGSAPSVESAVQHQDSRVTEVVKQPPGARGPHHAATAVEHHAAVHVDAEASEQVLENGRLRQGEIESGGGVARSLRQVEKLRARNVRAIIGYPPQLALHTRTLGFEVGGGLQDAQVGVSESAFEIAGRDQVVVANQFHHDVALGAVVQLAEYNHHTGIPRAFKEGGMGMGVAPWSSSLLARESFLSASRRVGVTPITASRSLW